MSFPPKGDEFQMYRSREVYQGELTNMKVQLGKQTGLALALLTTLLATFFAMGVFSVAQANTHSATRSITPSTVAPGGELTVSIALSEYGDGGSVTDTLPTGFSLVSGSVQRVGGDGFNRPTSNQVQVILADAGVTSVSYKATAPSEAGGPHAFTGNFVSLDMGAVAIVGVSMVTVAADATGGDDDLATVKTEPGSNQSLKVKGKVVYGETDNIIVNLKDFGVPSSIDPSHVLVTRDGVNATPSDVEVDGTKVTLVGPFDPETAGAGNLSAEADDTTIIDFRRAAGITLPIRHGDYDVKVSTASTTEEDGDGFENKVEVRRQVKVSPTSGTRGTEVTITGKGFLDGTAKVSIGATNYSINANIDDGAFTATVDTAVRDNDGNNVFDGAITGTGEDADRDTTIEVSDSDLNTASTSFEIKPSFTFSPESPTPGEDVTISLVDISNAPISVTFTGAPPIMDVAADPNATPPVTAEDNIRDSDGDASTTTGWKVQVPGTTRIGTVRVTIDHPDADDPLTKTIIIGTKSLELQPQHRCPRPGNHHPGQWLQGPGYHRPGECHHRHQAIR